MAITVGEIINPEVLSLRPDETAADALGYLRAMHVSGAPVLDAELKPVGVVTWDDLAAAPPDARVTDQMNAPPLTVGLTASIREAAHAIAASGHHRLVVVNGTGRAVGVVSALDVVRALLGVPIRHPAAFPHYDAATGLIWSDPATLEVDAAGQVADGPGLLTLITGGALVPERLIWAEQCSDLRARLLELLVDPRARPPGVGAWLEAGALRFRVASCAQAEDRWRALDVVLDREITMPPPR